MAAVASTSSPGAVGAEGKRWLTPTAVGVTQGDQARSFIAEWKEAVQSGHFGTWVSQLLTDNVPISKVPGIVAHGPPYTLEVNLNMPLILGRSSD